MVRKTPSAIAATLVLLAAGAAWASHQLIGPSPGIAVNGPTTITATTAPTSPTTTTTPTSTGVTRTTTPGITSTTPGITATTPGITSTTTPPTGGTITTGPSTGVLGTGTPSTTGTIPTTTAQATPTTPSTTPTTPSTTPTTPTSTTPSNVLGIDQVVSFTRTVAPGSGPVTAFSVPAGQQLVVTDVFITNPGTAPICGASVSPGGATAPPTTGAPAAPTSSESGTGLLCVPAQTSLSLGLTTGLEFNAGQSVVLANTAPAGTTTTPGGPLHYHLRGFLVSPTGS
jgi:hypothetical protein